MINIDIDIDIDINIYIIYIITHGKAQQSGKQTGTTALPLLDFDLLLPDASYSYFALAFCHPPYNKKSADNLLYYT